MPRLVLSPTVFQWEGVGGENTTNGIKATIPLANGMGRGIYALTPTKTHENGG